jgi:hypothetical protein
MASSLLLRILRNARTGSVPQRFGQNTSEDSIVRAKLSRRIVRANLIICLALTGCSHAISDTHAEAQLEVQLDAVCTEPRSQICPMNYLPVCALRDTGVRCVKAPCPSTEWVSYPNACAACRRPEVTGYLEGQCEAEDEGKKLE